MNHVFFVPSGSFLILLAGLNSLKHIYIDIPLDTLDPDKALQDCDHLERGVRPLFGDRKPKVIYDVIEERSGQELRRRLTVASSAE